MTIKPRVFLLCAGLAAFTSAPAIASPVIVELYTSQGCSSCPAADALVRDFPRLGLGRDKVLALTFHVNYWDDLGWKDPFSAPAFTERQSWYAHSGQLLSLEGGSATAGLYTPQMIVGGKVHFSGARRASAMSAIQHAAAQTSVVDVGGQSTITRDEIDVAIRVSPRATVDRRADWRLVVALAAKSARTNVPSGENRGESLEEASIVRVLSDRLPLALSSPETIHVKLQRPSNIPLDNLELTAFVQSERTREIAGAASIPVTPAPLLRVQSARNVSP